MPFDAALTGLNAATTDLEVTGNNIANASTVGFKESRAEFADVYATSVQDLGDTVAGAGVQVSSITQQFSQGTVDFTSNNLDLAINGEGFFVLEDSGGGVQYTRAGAYSADRDGYVVNSSGARLQIYPSVDPTAEPPTFSTGVLDDLQLPLANNDPRATQNVGVAINMEAGQTEPVVAFDETDPASYNFSTSTTVYDSLGSTHTQTMYMRKTANPGEWDVYTYIDGNQVPTSAGPAAATLTFDTNGLLLSPASGTITLAPYTPAASTAALNITMDFADSTQFGGNFAVNNISQDGFSTGRLSGVDIDDEGIIYARYTNGESTTLGKVAMANFRNPQGLRSVGDTSWVETFTSGTVRYGEAGTSDFGQIQSGALESSNVDIATQLVNLITAQRNYQANAKVISTADTVTQTIINIR